MIPICLSKQIKKDKFFEYNNILLFRDQYDPEVLRVFPKVCPHLGYSFSNLTPKENQVVCPYHDRTFCSSYAEKISIFEYRGIVWLDNSKISDLVMKSLSQVTPAKWRSFKFKTNWKNLLANVLDFSHLTAVHKYSTGASLSKPSISVDTTDQSHISIIWKSQLSRPKTAEVWLDLDTKAVLVKVPFASSWLYTLSFVSFNQQKLNESTLLVSYWFEEKNLDENLWLRFWTDRIVDLLVFEDKKILAKVETDAPFLRDENNPLIKQIYDK